MVEKASCDQATEGKNLVWFGKYKEISQIINDYLYLLLFLISVMDMDLELYVLAKSKPHVKATSHSIS